jgi:hypothetical protein
MTPAGGRLALASRAADGVSAGIPIVPVDPQLLQALVKSIVSCLGTAPGLPVSHFQQNATRASAAACRARNSRRADSLDSLAHYQLHAREAI